MVEENPQIPKENPAFEKMKQVVPPREIELPSEDGEGDGGGHGTLEERMETSPKLSDMQTADRRLNPDLGYRHLNIMQMSRVFPDVYNPLFRIMVKDLIRRSRAEKNEDGIAKRMTVAEAIAYVNTALSMAIDGEARIDEINIMGRAIAEDVEKTKNSMGGM